MQSNESGAKIAISKGKVVQKIQLLKVELSSKSENIWKCLKPFRERAGIVRIWHFPSSCKAEGREPWVSPGYPQKSGFFQGSWTSFSGFWTPIPPFPQSNFGGV